MKFNIWLNNKLINSVFYYHKTETIAEMIETVKRGLIDHDGYDPNIKVTFAKGQRVTEAVYELHGHYSYGYELLTAEMSLEDIIQRKKEYMANSPCRMRIVIRKERK